MTANEALNVLTQRFTSGNSISVSQARITREEFEAIKVVKLHLDDVASELLAAALAEKDTLQQQLYDLTCRTEGLEVRMHLNLGKVTHARGLNLSRVQVRETPKQLLSALVTRALEDLVVRATPKITGVAIKYNNTVYSLPAPNRHHNVIRHIRDVTGEGIAGPATQGFITETGEFLNRRDAMQRAITTGQLNRVIGKEFYQGQSFIQKTCGYQSRKDNANRTD